MNDVSNNTFAVDDRGKSAKCSDCNYVVDNILQKYARVIGRERDNEMLESFRSATNMRGNVRFVRETQVLRGTGSQTTRNDSVGAEEKNENDVRNFLEFPSQPVFASSMPTERGQYSSTREDQPRVETP